MRSSDINNAIQQGKTKNNEKKDNNLVDSNSDGDSQADRLSSLQVLF